MNTCHPRLPMHSSLSSLSFYHSLPISFHLHPLPLTLLFRSPLSPSLLFPSVPPSLSNASVLFFPLPPPPSVSFSFPPSLLSPSPHSLPSPCLPLSPPDIPHPRNCQVDIVPCSFKHPSRLSAQTALYVSPTQACLKGAREHKSCSSGNFLRALAGHSPRKGASIKPTRALASSTLLTMSFPSVRHSAFCR